MVSIYTIYFTYWIFIQITFNACYGVICQNGAHANTFAECSTESTVSSKQIQFNGQSIDPVTKQSSSGDRSNIEATILASILSNTAATQYSRDENLNLEKKPAPAQSATAFTESVQSGYSGLTGNAQEKATENSITSNTDIFSTSDNSEDKLMQPDKVIKKKCKTNGLEIKVIWNPAKMTEKLSQISKGSLKKNLGRYRRSTDTSSMNSAGTKGKNKNEKSIFDKIRAKIRDSISNAK